MKRLTCGENRKGNWVDMLELWRGLWPIKSSDLECISWLACLPPGGIVWYSPSTPEELSPSSLTLTLPITRREKSRNSQIPSKNRQKPNSINHIKEQEPTTKNPFPALPTVQK
ncbi:hypothetical protein ACLOJK_000002 [Asimina triloba]